MALRLYILNGKVSAAVMIDLHFVEIALRNKFDRELCAKFGQRWYQDPAFLALVDVPTGNILNKAQRDAGKHLPKGIVPFHGKVVAELTFGFWLRLTDSRLEHTLWVPALHKAFPRPPKRSAFNQQLEKLRQLRNRVAHHEPIFHLDLLAARQGIEDACRLLCPHTAHVMVTTSTMHREIMGVHKFRRRKGL